MTSPFNASWVERLVRRVIELEKERDEVQDEMDRAEANIFLDERGRNALLTHDACASSFQSESAIARFDYRIALDNTRIESGPALVTAIEADIVLLRRLIKLISEATGDTDPLVLLALRELFDVQD